MRNFWREYGLIAALIVIGMATYLLYHQQKEHLLAASLDLLGTHLIAMVDGSEGQQGTVARLFERFKEGVVNREIPPEHVEYVAANVLNLSNSGARLTPEEIELVLQPAAGAPEAPAVAGGPLAPEARPQPLPPVSAEALSHTRRRLEDVLTFETHLQELLPEDPDQRQLLAEHIRFHFDGGLRVVIDEDATDVLSEAERTRFLEAVRGLEANRQVLWEKHLAHTEQARRARIEAERRILENLRRQLPPEGAGFSKIPTGDPRAEAPEAGLLAFFTTLKRLETLGYLPPAEQDSVRIAVQAALQAALAEADAGAAAPATPPDIETMLSLYQTHINEYLEAYEAQLKTYLERLEAQRAAEEARLAVPPPM